MASVLKHSLIVLGYLLAPLQPFKNKKSKTKEKFSAL